MTPSAWKLAADAEREAGDRLADAYRQQFLIRRGAAFEWKAPANDNQGWPLAKLLRAEGRDDLLRVAARYRQLDAVASNPSPLVGSDLEGAVPLDQRTWLRPDGELAYKGARRLTARGFDDEEPTRNGLPLPKKWTGDDPLNAMIDAKKAMERLRGRLGPLSEFVDDACIHGETLEAIGRSRGIGNEAGAKGAGRALVFLGLEVLAEALLAERD